MEFLFGFSRGRKGKEGAKSFDAQSLDLKQDGDDPIQGVKEACHGGEALFVESSQFGILPRMRSRTDVLKREADVIQGLVELGFLAALQDGFGDLPEIRICLVVVLAIAGADVFVHHAQLFEGANIGTDGAFGHADYRYEVIQRERGGGEVERSVQGAHGARVAPELADAAEVFDEGLTGLA